MSARGCQSSIGTVTTLAVLLQGCGGYVEDSTESSQDPIIFGSDNRIEYGGISDPNWHHYAQGTAALFAAAAVACGGGSCDLDTVPFQSAFTGGIFDPYPLCTNAPYFGQEQGAFCTAFLVGPDIFATAGHCFCGSSPATCGTPFGQSACSTMRVVFGFHADANGNNEVVNVPSTDVYSCSEVVGVWKTSPSDEDWAVFRVDREVSNRTALIARYTDTPPSSGELVLVGHPDGLPVKLAGSGQPKGDPASDPVNWTSSVDAFAGNSGSPVIQQATGVVQGIHVRRPAQHYVLQGGCAMPQVCSATSGCSPNNGSPWAQHTNMGWAAAQAELPLHAALITAL